MAMDPKKDYQGLSDKCLAMIDEVRDFCEKEVRQTAIDADANPEVQDKKMMEVIDKACKLGYNA